MNLLEKLFVASAFAASVACAISAQAQSFTSSQGLTLRQAEERLLANNRDILAARRAVEASQANTLSAGARPNPTLSLGLSSINPSAGIGSGTLRDKTVDTSVRVDQVFERGNRRELRIELAKSLESASAGDLDEVIRQRRLALRFAYYDLAVAQDRSGVLAETAALFTRSVEAAQKRFAAGDISAADVSRIRVDALRAESDARLADSERRRAQLALALITGSELETGTISARDPWPALSDVPAAAAQPLDTEALERRPDVRAARRRLDSAQKARELARSLRTRDFSVGAQFDRYPSSGSNTLGTGNSFGVFVSVPLFVNYAFDGEIRRAEVDYSAAEEALARLVAEARAEGQRTQGDLHAASDRLRRYVQTLAEAMRSASAAEFAYANGAMGVMDLLDARRTLRAIQIESVNARAEHARAWAAWRAVTGDF